MKWELLLIDDEPSILDVLAELLSDDGINVTTAINGDEGLKLLKERHFDLVVSDISMPKMDGPSMLNQTRINGIYTPVIFFSAHADFTLARELKALGAIGVVRKPYCEKLLAEINGFLGRKELMLRNSIVPESQSGKRTPISLPL